MIFRNRFLRLVSGHVAYLKIYFHFIPTKKMVHIVMANSQTVQCCPDQIDLLVFFISHFFQFFHCSKSTNFPSFSRFASKITPFRVFQLSHRSTQHQSQHSKPTPSISKFKEEPKSIHPIEKCTEGHQIKQRK